jgi:hypothetical protein
MNDMTPWMSYSMHHIMLSMQWFVWMVAHLKNKRDMNCLLMYVTVVRIGNHHFMLHADRR